MGLLGSEVKNANVKLRFCVIVFMGVLAFGSVLFWKAQLMMSTEYEGMPVTHEQVKLKKSNLLKQREMQRKLIETE